MCKVQGLGGGGGEGARGRGRKRERERERETELGAISRQLKLHITQSPREYFQASRDERRNPSRGLGIGTFCQVDIEAIRLKALNPKP